VSGAGTFRTGPDRTPARAAHPDLGRDGDGAATAARLDRWPTDVLRPAEDRGDLVRQRHEPAEIAAIERGTVVGVELGTLRLRASSKY
jgi:hypothetical protein